MGRDRNESRMPTGETPGSALRETSIGVGEGFTRSDVNRGCLDVGSPLDDQNETGNGERDSAAGHKIFDLDTMKERPAVEQGFLPRNPRFPNER